MAHSDHLDDPSTTTALLTVNSSHNGGGVEGCKRMGVDEALQKYCGEFGPWQLKQFVLTSLAWVLTAFHTMVVVFADRTPAWQCTAAAASEGRCTGGDLCRLEPGSWEWVGGAGSSTVAEWELVCGGKYLAGVAQSVFFAGSMIGCGVFGHLSDSFMGRKGALTLAHTMNTALGCLTSFSPSYTVYTAFRFLTGLGTGGGSACAFLLATEPVGPTQRGTAGMCTFYFFSVGCVLLAGVAHSYPAWRTLYVLASLPSFLFVLAVLPFVAESPRWQLTGGRSSEALSTMAAIAKCNGRHLPDDISLALDCDNSTSSGKPEPGNVAAAASGSIVDAIRSPTTRLRLFSAVLINFFGCVVYYGLTLNVANLKTNLYASVILNAVSEMPAYALATILMKWLGRKPLLIGSIWLSGLFCLVGSFLYVNGFKGELSMGCGVVGIFAISAMFNLFFVYTVELFPTVVRNAALGCVMLAGQMGAILAPMVVALGGDVPFTVFGVCGVVGGLFAFRLPETANKPLYDTLEGVEEDKNVANGVA